MIQFGPPKVEYPHQNERANDTGNTIQIMFGQWGVYISPEEAVTLADDLRTVVDRNELLLTKGRR